MVKYSIVYTKTAVKDIPKLKTAHLDAKAKAIILAKKRNSVPLLLLLAETSTPTQ